MQQAATALRAILSWNSPKIRCPLAKSCSFHHLMLSTYVNNKKFVAAVKIHQLAPASDFVQSQLSQARCSLEREFRTSSLPNAVTASSCKENSLQCADRQRLCLQVKVMETLQCDFLTQPISMSTQKRLIQLPSRRTDNNAVLEKCLTSCHGEILGQAPCDNVDVTRCGNIHNPWLVSLSMLQCHETSAL